MGVNIEVAQRCIDDIGESLSELKEDGVMEYVRGEYLDRLEAHAMALLSYVYDQRRLEADA